MTILACVRPALPLVLATLVGCAPGSAPATSTDAADAMLGEASADSTSDASFDSTSDARIDATSDASVDSVTDSASEASADAASDAPAPVGAGWAAPHTRLAVAAGCGDCIHVLAAGASPAGLTVVGEFAGPLVDVSAPGNTRGVFVARFDPASARSWLRLYGQSGAGSMPALGAAASNADGETVLTRIVDGGGATAVELVLLDTAGNERWSVVLGTGLSGTDAYTRAGVSITMNADTIALLTSAPDGGGAISTFARADGHARWSVSFAATDAHRPAPYWTVTYGRHALAMDDAGDVFAPSAGALSVGGAAPIARYDAASGAFVAASDPSTCGVSSHATNLFWVHLPGAAPFGCTGSFAASGQQLVGVGSAGGFASDYGVATVNFMDVSQVPFPGSVGGGWSHAGALLYSGSSMTTIAPDGTVYAMGTGLIVGPPNLDAVVFRKFLADGTPAP